MALRSMRSKARQRREKVFLPSNPLSKTKMWARMKKTVRSIRNATRSLIIHRSRVLYVRRWCMQHMQMTFPLSLVISDQLHRFFLIIHQKVNVCSTFAALCEKYILTLWEAKKSLLVCGVSIIQPVAITKAARSSLCSNFFPSPSSFRFLPSAPFHPAYSKNTHTDILLCVREREREQYFSSSSNTQRFSRTISILFFQQLLIELLVISFLLDDFRLQVTLLPLLIGLPYGLFCLICHKNT